MARSTGSLRDPFAEHPGDQMMGSFRDVRGTSVIHVLNSAQKHIKLTLTSYSKLYSKL